METGIYDINDEVYFQEEGLSNSYLWQVISRTPAHAQIKFAPTDAMELGSAVHLAVLQPELAATHIIQGPKDRRSKAWKDKKTKAEEDGKILLIEKDYHTAMSMRDAVWRNSMFAELLTGEGVKYEHAAFWEYRDQKCKCKVDCAKPGLILDLKTSTDASARGFQQSVAKYGYHQQAASYKHGWATANNEVIETVLFLVIEKSPPYAPALFELDAPAMAEGWASYNAAIDLHIKCEENQNFTAYPTEKQLLTLPTWGFSHTNPRHIDLKGEST